MMDEMLIIGIDSSTQSTKAIAWNLSGEAIAEGRAPIPMDNPQADYSEQNVEDWWQASVTALQDLWQSISPKNVVAISISNQRETLAFLDDNGKATRPAMVWLDERAKEDVALLVDKCGADKIHHITGKPIDMTPCIYRLNWMQRNSPKILQKTAKILDVHGFLSWRLTGKPTASRTSADPFGIFDIHQMDWSQELLEAVGLTKAQLPDLAAPGEKIGKISKEAAQQTGLIEGTPLIAGGGDGQCAGLGVNATREGIAYLNLGTAIITGAWSSEAAIDKYWRTMTSPTGEGYFLESVQRTGAYLINWFIDNFAGGRDNPKIFDELEEKATHLPIGSNGLLCCPYLSGCMDPHWDSNAKGSFIGLSPSHTTAHLYRACLEGLTLTISQAIEAMTSKGIIIKEIYAVGGGANSQLWRQMIADASQLPVKVSQSNEASALGAGITAAVGGGCFSNFNKAADAMTSLSHTTLPNANLYDEWQSLSKRHEKIYHATKDLL